MAIFKAICLIIRLSFCLCFRPSHKTLKAQRFFCGKTGTSPAKALTERRARKERAEESYEKNRSHHQAVQARRSERGPAGSGRPGHYRDRGQGLWPAKGPYRTLSGG